LYVKFLSLISLVLLSSCQVNLVLQPKKTAAQQNFSSPKSSRNKIEVDKSLKNLEGDFLKNQPILSQDYSIENFYFVSENGRKINAWILKSRTEKPKISIFALHGNTGNLYSQYQNFSELTKFGFQVFLFDYSGFGFSEGKSTRKNAIEDSFSAFHFFKNLPEIKNTPKIIYGQSIGGNFSIPVATKNQEQISGLVLEGTFTNFKNIANRKIPVLGGLIIKNNYDNRFNLKSFKKPVLVIHSKEDRVIPFQMGTQLFDNANQPKDFLEINQPHIKGIQFYAPEISQKIYQMIH
jgi:pimeloyl-ACP methyl ester carboxylesterase